MRRSIHVNRDSPDALLVSPCNFLFCWANEWWQCFFQWAYGSSCIIGSIVISCAVSKADITEPGRELTDHEGALLSEMSDTPGVAMHHHCFKVACCSWIALFGLIRANGALTWQLKIKCCVMKYLVFAPFNQASLGWVSGPLTQLLHKGLLQVEIRAWAVFLEGD